MNVAQHMVDRSFVSPGSDRVAEPTANTTTGMIVDAQFDPDVWRHRLSHIIEESFDTVLPELRFSLKMDDF